MVGEKIESGYRLFTYGSKEILFLGGPFRLYYPLLCEFKDNSFMGMTSLGEVSSLVCIAWRKGLIFVIDFKLSTIAHSYTEGSGK